MAGILLRIRFLEILLIGDIEKALLMVGLDEDSRHFTRFLWLRDPSLGTQEGNIVTHVFKRVPFSLITSPFLLAGTIHYHLCNYNTPLAQKILRNIYVDDLFLDATNIDDAEQVYEEAKEIFRQAGMNVREFASNDSSFDKFLEKIERTPVDKTMKILVLQWDTETDSLILSLPKFTELNTTWTKRKILKHVASIYDPLGWVSPSTLIAKAFIQKLWKTQLPWDAVLPQELSEEWISILSNWTVSKIDLPRKIASDRTRTYKGVVVDVLSVVVRDGVVEELSVVVRGVVVDELTVVVVNAVVDVLPVVVDEVDVLPVVVRGVVVEELAVVVVGAVVDVLPVVADKVDVLPVVVRGVVVDVL